MLVSIVTVFQLLIYTLVFLCLLSLFRYNPKKLLLNPIAYCSVCSLMYLGVPYITPEYLFEHFNYPINESAILGVKILSIYVNVVFGCLLCLSNRYVMPKFTIITVNNDITPLARQYLLFILSIVGFIAVYIFFKYAPILLANFSSRGAAYVIYSEIFNSFKIPIIFAIASVCSITLSIFSEFKLYYFIPQVILLLLAGLSGDRDMIFSVIVFFMLIGVVKLPVKKLKLVVKFTGVSMLFLVMFRVFQNGYFNTGSDGLRLDYVLLSEFYHTAFTSTYILQNDLLLQGDLIRYVYTPILKNISVLIDLEPVPWYANIISEHIGRGFGFAGNILSESLFYGGVLMVLIYPFLIAFCLLFWVYIWRKGSYWGFLMLLLYIPNIRLFFRGSFWDNYISIFQWSIFIIPIIILFFKKRGVNYE